MNRLNQLNPNNQPNQSGAGPVVPTVIKNISSRNTPYIENTIRQETKVNKQYTPNQSNTKQPYNKEQSYNKTEGTPIINSTSIKNPSTMKPTFKLEMFEPEAPKTRPVGTYNPLMPLLNVAGNKDFSQQAFNYLSAPTSGISYGPNVQLPIQNVYEITLPGPTGDHVRMNRIYENVLPHTKNGKFSETTLGERLQTYDYVRQILIRTNEGEEIGLEDETHSLLSHIKLMELYPNYYSPINDNPYKGLPFGFLIYRSCFPVIYDKTSESISCNRNSMGLNIRFYALSIAEYYSYKFGTQIYKEYDVWRELSYYEYIRENIIKKKQSPNFPLMYSFFMSPNNKIDFFSIKKKCLTQKVSFTKDYQNQMLTHKLFSKVTPSTQIIRPMSLLSAAKNVIGKLPDEIDPSLQAYSGTTLVAVTESPSHNIYQWASRKYEILGAKRSMIAQGFYSEKIWKVILFQIISALHVMQVHGIYIKDMTMEDNIYIKDLKSYGKSMGYWKYIINGISYYAPNYGYLVLIDTNYKDIYPSGKTIEPCSREYKIYSHNIFNKTIPLDELKAKIFENYRKIINSNSFTKEHTQNDVFRPPEQTMSLLNKLMVDPETDLGKVISKYFRSMMNNRIGTFLRKDTEIPNIRENVAQLKVGELAIEVIESDVYKWCMVHEIKSDGIIEIITREDPDSDDYISKDVRTETLKQYSMSEKIDQLSKPDINLSEEELLETYIVSN